MAVQEGSGPFPYISGCCVSMLDETHEHIHAHNFLLTVRTQESMVSVVSEVSTSRRGIRCIPMKTENKQVSSLCSDRYLPLAHLSFRREVYLS
jgi:hypothetical protein